MIPKWLVVVIVVGVLLDLAISTVLIVQQTQVNANTSNLQVNAKKAHCWDSVLDRAVTDHPTRASLVARAEVCRSLP